MSANATPPRSEVPVPTVDELRNMTPEQLAEAAEAQTKRLIIGLFTDDEVHLTLTELYGSVGQYATRREIRRALDQLCLNGVLAETETRNKEATVHTYHLVPTTGGTP
jgi:hypothetical protein